MYITPAALFLLPSTFIFLNFFLFENAYYLQKCGTAMGSKMAPNYANLYVGLLENQFIFDSSHNPFLHHIKLWKRFIDNMGWQPIRI